ncbi:hypothetical protein, partial [Pseudoalteromonas distincta]|uniref:hypothetical protein n=1 Tax=Pseudoalteromonas distincta TaxID=77608 RepID=UPI0034E83C9A
EVLEKLRPLPAADQKTLPNLIAQLGDADFRTREDAQAAIKKMGVAALPEIVKAMGSTDPETDNRARELFKYGVGANTLRPLRDREDAYDQND